MPTGGKRVPDGTVSPCRCSAASHFPKRSAHAGKSGESSRAALTFVGRRRSRLNDRLRGDNSSKRAEGVPAFGLPVLSLILLVESFLF